MKVTDLKLNAPMPLSRHIEKGQPADQKDKEDQRLKDASKKLEGQFLTFMLKAMENTIPKDQKENSQSLASMMFSSVMGNAISEDGGIGLADFIYKSLKEHGTDALKNMQEINPLNHLINLKTMDLNDE